jgi:hypothetical protein
MDLLLIGWVGVSCIMLFVAAVRRDLRKEALGVLGLMWGFALLLV